MFKSMGVVDEFEYNLSAFLSASRSILQYALEECKINGNQKWCVDYLNSSEVIAFFKDKRNINIHEVPVKTIQRQQSTNTLNLPLSLTFQKIDKDGIISEKILEPNHSANKIEHNIKSGYNLTYLFDDSNGDKSVLELCEMFVNELSNFIKEGTEKNYITG
jgi:hypothetical protein